MSHKTVLEESELTYYSRQIVSSDIGLNGQKKLKDSRVLVAGVGGLGSHLAIQLASMGVGYLRLVDRDVVEISNLNRQHLYGVDDLGYPKVEAAQKRLEKINPYIKVEPIPASINSHSAVGLVEGIDVVVDGMDRLTPRLAINRACHDRGIPYVYGSAITHIGNVSTIIPYKSACLDCWQGRVDEENIPTCATVGVIPPIINIIASIQASEAIKIILGGNPSLVGKLLFCDLSDVSFEVIALKKADTCPTCSGNIKPKKTFTSVEELCGREGKRVFIISPKKIANLDLDDVEKKMKSKSLSVEKKTRLGVMFYKLDMKGSVFTSGVAVLEGPANKEEALALYMLVVGDSNIQIT